MFENKATGLIRRSACLSKPRITKRTRILYSEACSTSYNTNMVGDPFFNIPQEALSHSIPILLSLPFPFHNNYNQSYPLTQPSRLRSHHQSVPLLQSFSPASAIQTSPCFLESCKEITALTITDSLSLRLRKLIYCK